MTEPAPRPLDLSRYSEATRQALYDLAVAEYFTPIRDDDGEMLAPLYTPEQAGLQVLFLYGRWLVTWWKLEEPAEAAEGERRELLLVEPDPWGSGRVVYREM